MNRTKRLGRDIILFALASFVPKIISFFLVPLYTSYVSTSAYGTFDLLNTVVSLILPILVLDISDSILVFTVQAKCNDKEKYLFYGNKILLIAAGISFIIISIVIAILGFDTVGFQGAYIWTQFVLMAFYNNLLAYLRGNDLVNWIVIMSIVNSLITITANVIFILGFNMGIFGLMMANTFGWLISNLLICIKIKPNTIFKYYEIPNQEKKEMLAYSCPLIIAGLSWWVISSEDRLFVSVLLGTSVNGIYAVATKIPTILNACHSVIYQAMQLSVFSEIESDDRASYLKRLYNIYSTCMLLITSFLIMTDMFLSRFLYKKDYFIAWKYVPGLVIAIALFSIAGYITTIAAANRDSKIITKATLSGAILNTILNAVLIHAIGLTGAVVATMVSYFVVWLIITCNTNRTMELELSIGRIIISVLYLCIQWWLLLKFNGNILIQLVMFMGFIGIHFNVLMGIFSKTITVIVKRKN